MPVEREGRGDDVIKTLGVQIPRPDRNTTGAFSNVSTPGPGFKVRLEAPSLQDLCGRRAHRCVCSHLDGPTRLHVDGRSEGESHAVTSSSGGLAPPAADGRCQDDFTAGLLDTRIQSRLASTTFPGVCLESALNVAAGFRTGAVRHPTVRTGT